MHGRWMHALLLCTQHLWSFGDQSDYITTFTRMLEIGWIFFAFLWTERLLFETLSLTLAKNHKLFNFTLCNVFLAPDLSKHYPKLAIKLGLSCSLVGSLVIGFIHYTFVYFLVIIRWGSNEVSYTQIKSLLSIEKSLIAAWGKLLSYLTLSVN